MLKRLPLACLPALVLAGCADEGPVGLEPLVPPGMVRSFEVVLDADRFLVMDTTITGFSKASGSEYGVVANAYAGVLNAHTLLRPALPIGSITYRDATGTPQTDDSPIVLGGELILEVDTLQVRPSEPVSFALYRIGEEWDPASASWSLRVDSGGVSLPWAQAGGTPDAFVSTAQLNPQANQLSFIVDSATMRIWSDTLNGARGALIVSETPGTRLRFNAFRFVVQAMPEARPDTIVFDTVGLNSLTFVYDPPPASDGSMLVGGTPAWRSYLQFRDRLDTLTVQAPCVDSPGETCTVRLGDANINYAGLVFTPTAPPAGFAPDDTVRIAFFRILGAGQIPIARAPLGAALGQLTVPPTSFATGEPAEFTFTQPLRSIVQLMANDEDAPPITVAMLDALAGTKFGIASFAPMSAGASAPKLRLIISVTDQDRIR